ncbi:MAG: hypothetical protein ACKOE4_02160 [Candidatus Kapaibacterium sp.]
MQNLSFAGNFGCRQISVVPLLALLALLWGCSAVQPVRVLDTGADAITASIGGAVVPNSSPTGVVPYLTSGYAYGLTDDVTLHGKAHLLMAAFGVAGLDVGASMRALRQDGAVPEITVGAQVLGFASLVRSAPARVYPNLTANASWSVGETSLVYLGSHATIQIDPARTLISPFAGYQVLVSNALRLQVEAIWQASNVNTLNGVFEGESSIGGTGSFGIYLGGMLAL